MTPPPQKSRSFRHAARAARPAVHPQSIETVRHLGDRLVRIDSPVATQTPATVNNPPVDLDIALAEMGTESIQANSTETESATEAASPTETASPRDWLTYHASDLIDRLTQWSDDLDVREANLHTQQAMWDRQARRLRLQFQEAQFELDQIAARLEQSHERVAEREDELRMTAKRLALASI